MPFDPLTYTKTIQPGRSVQIEAMDTKIDTLIGYTDQEIADILAAVNAVKSKTDLLPGDPADASDIAALFAAMMPVTSLMGTTQQTSGTSDTPSSYTQMVAAAGMTKDSPYSFMCGAFRNNDLINSGRAIIRIGIGGSGAEVEIAQWNGGCAPGGATSFVIPITRKVVAGTRWAVRSSWSGGTGATVDISWFIGQVA